MTPNNMITNTRGRPRSGQAVVVLIFFLTAFLIGPLSFFAYELSLYNLAKQQLKACVDSAALGAGCSMASNSDLTNFGVVQTEAEACALWVFQQNSILGDPMSGANSSIVPGGPSALTATAHKGELTWMWIDSTGTQVADGDPTGKQVRIWGDYGFVPAFAKFVGMSGMTFGVTDFGNGALPQLDVVLCFDLSSSMDDFTYVFLVKRYWNPTQLPTAPAGYTDYAVVNDTTTGGAANTQGPLLNDARALYYALGCTDVTGTGLNCTWPAILNSTAQQTRTCYGRGSGGTLAQPIWTSGSTTGTRAAAVDNYGTPPYTNSATIGTTKFTDVIVDVSWQFASNQGNAQDGVCMDGYMWPIVGDNGAAAMPVGAVVEASRGNLEDPTYTVAKNCGLVPNSVANPVSVSFTTQPNRAGTSAVISCAAGWYNRYWQIANRWTYLNPIGAGAIASQKFFQIINNDADSHFGLVCYGSDEDNGVNTDTAFVASGETNVAYSLSPSSNAYPWDSLPYSPCPYVALVNSISTTNFNTCYNIFLNTYSGTGAASSGGQTAAINNQLKPNGSTDIAGALKSALGQLMTSNEASQGSPSVGTGNGATLTRKNSHRAVVLFTDGLPTVSTVTGQAIPDALAMGSNAGSAGIPVYCIGLCMTNALQVNQNAVLNDTNGIAGLSAPQAQYFQATNGNSLITAFEAVARSLVQLVQN